MSRYMKLAVFLTVFAGFIGLPALYADWVDNGIPLCIASGAQDSPVITTDGARGAIIAWRDSRTVVNTDIYAQRVDADGVISWYDTGNPVCTFSGPQSQPLIIPDGAGGAIIAWTDARFGPAGIYAQKLNSDGYYEWTLNGTGICTGQTGLILGSMISDGSGGAIITWHDRRNFYNDIFAQRISSNGTVQWTADGVTICGADWHQMNPTLVSDGAGGAIIAWQDARTDPNDIYAQRVNASGAVQWTEDGIVICNNANQQSYPQVVEDGSGGAIIAWMDIRYGMDFDIFGQRVDASGNLLWGPSGAAIALTMYDQVDCRLIHIGSGECIVTWVDNRGGDEDVYAQKMNASGTRQWGSSGVVVCDAANDQFDARIVSNGAGGAFITWDDERGGTANADIYAQNIDGSGTAGWTVNGEPICDATGQQVTPEIAADGANGMVIAWTDARGGTNKVYSHRVDAAGHIPTATLLYNFSAALDGSDIRIKWTLSEIDEGVEFLVLRASEPTMAFREIPSIDIDQDGMSFIFVDEGCEPGETYYYRVVVQDGGELKVLFETGPINTPSMALTLDQNLPNPFNPRTTISYSLPERCKVELEIYDVTGRRITVLVNKFQSRGSYSVNWNGRDSNGSTAGSGVYFYRLRAGKHMISRKMVLMR